MAAASSLDLPPGDRAALAAAAGAAPLERLLLWLASYDDLFSRRCSSSVNVLGSAHRLMS